MEGRLGTSQGGGDSLTCSRASFVHLISEHKNAIWQQTIFKLCKALRRGRVRTWEGHRRRLSVWGGQALGLVCPQDPAILEAPLWEAAWGGQGPCFHWWQSLVLGLGLEGKACDQVCGADCPLPWGHADALRHWVCYWQPRAQNEDGLPMGLRT